MIVTGMAEPLSGSFAGLHSRSRPRLFLHLGHLGAAPHSLTFVSAVGEVVFLTGLICGSLISEFMHLILGL